MSPRLIDAKRCPHCQAELPRPVPRVCPRCAGSLQARHLRVGCLSSAPPILLLGSGLWLAWRLLAG